MKRCHPASRDHPYRQLLCISLFGGGRFEVDLIHLSMHRAEGTFRTGDAILAELDDLGASSIVGLLESGRVQPMLDAQTPMFQAPQTPLGAVRLTPFGQRLYDLMGLQTVPEDELRELLVALQGG